jgi:hypothetical protein
LVPLENQYGAKMKKFLFALMLAASIVLSGCMAIKYDQTVERDGTSTVIQQLDMSALVSWYESMYEDMGEDYDTDALENMTMQMNEICIESRAQGADCTYSEADYLLTLTVDSLTPEDAGYEFEKTYSFPNVVYTFRADQIPEMGIEFDEDDNSLFDTSASDEVSGKFDEVDAASVASLKMVGMELEYAITMPGEITEAKNGEIDDEGRAVYDLIELMDEGETIEVVSQETDPIGSLCGTPVLALASALFFAAFARRA